jgi:hypothetical protein
MLAPTTVIDNEYASLWVYESQGIVHHQFKKFISGENFRSVLSTGLKELTTRRAKKWLSDDRSNGALKPEDEEWAQGVWFPKTVAAGWKYWAIIPPEKVVGKMNIQRFIQTFAKAGITAQVFPDPTDALKWLVEQ